MPSLEDIRAHLAASRLQFRPVEDHGGSHQIIHISPKPPPPPPAPLRTRTLQALDQIQADAEADPDDVVDVGEIIRVLKLVVDRVL